MVVHVGKGRNLILVAYAVDTEMLCYKNHGFLVRVIAGLGEPLYLAISVHINRIQVSGLFVCRRSIRNCNADGLPAQVDSSFLAVLYFP